MNQLEKLKQFSTIVVDSGNIEEIKKFQPQDVTTNPSLILKTINCGSYQKLLENALEFAKKIGGDKRYQITNAADKLIVNIGSHILEYIPGLISTEIDARLSFDYEKTIKKARKIIKLYEEQNINRSRILIKIAATWEGIKTAEQLKKEKINCNLTLIFSFAQARACAESEVFLISPFVGRIYDWYNQKKPFIQYSVDNDPGVKSIKKIYDYYKKHHYQTVIMGASFRKIEQILALAGCDKLTISPFFLNILINNNQDIQQKLFPTINPISNIKPIFLSETEFHHKHNKDIMAVEKLSEGIRLFTIDQEKLEMLLDKAL
ncbi:transaldolase [Blochmannia endosymbiont of Colobopsis nipponica]|uniref:transaldolase n=1 Tax=Blochmannia endosymbiont of Colobopsis nipponica TaxID=2681987 RepID=UPI00177E6DA1|nr:transaldolase [Blochmannia endosymbiont of Colobopsis nipponica]QOI10954.1 transaldolase [Blochmannia endosymbiont of Colobopsis nipponica]